MSGARLGPFHPSLIDYACEKRRIGLLVNRLVRVGIAKLPTGLAQIQGRRNSSHLFAVRLIDAFPPSISDLDRPFGTDDSRATETSDADYAMITGDGDPGAFPLLQSMSVRAIDDCFSDVPSGHCGKQQSECADQPRNDGRKPLGKPVYHLIHAV